MESIIQTDKSRCYLCGGSECGEHLDKHHVFFGAMRSKSEKYGLTVYLHHSKCHIFGKNSVHANAKNCKMIQKQVQAEAMKHYGWSIEDFIKLFGRNYI